MYVKITDTYQQKVQLRITFPRQDHYEKRSADNTGYLQNARDAPIRKEIKDKMREVMDCQNSLDTFFSEIRTIRLQKTLRVNFK